MSLRIVIDMNLSPEWVAELARRGYDAMHWSSIGDLRASDTAIMAGARVNGVVVLTHDLDFGTLLALTHANGPSVLQVRAQNVLPGHMGQWVVAALRQYEATLMSGALVVVEGNQIASACLAPVRFGYWFGFLGYSFVLCHVTGARLRPPIHPTIRSRRRYGFSVVAHPTSPAIGAAP